MAYGVMKIPPPQHGLTKLHILKLHFDSSFNALVQRRPFPT
jgi:hypothetical protein